MDLQAEIIPIEPGQVMLPRNDKQLMCNYTLLPLDVVLKPILLQ